MYLFNIVGNASSGKSEVREFLIELFEERFGSIFLDDLYVLKFADPMKMYNESLGFDDEANPGIKNRKFYQKLADLTKEIYGGDVFINVFKASHQELTENMDAVAVICDDCRYVKEMELCENLGYISIFVNCDEYVRRNRAKDMGVEFRPCHDSEMEVPLLRNRCNYHIENNTDNLLELKKAVEYIFKSEVS